MKVSRGVWGLLVLGMSAAACDDLFGITILSGSQGEPGDGGGHYEAGTHDEAGAYDEAGANPDAAADAADATPPPSVAAITGKEVFYYLTDSTMTHVNTDFSAGVVAHFIEADGGVTDYPGTGSGDGTFMIPGVPEGEFYVQFQPLPEEGWPLYGYSTSRTIDESVYNYGRPDIAYTDGGTTTVGYAISNLSLVNASLSNGFNTPYLAVFSIGAYAGWWVGCCDGNYSITFGTTTTGTQWFPEEIPLIDATSSGDITYALSYQWLVDAGIDPSSSSSPPPIQVVQSLQDDSFTMLQGSTSYITGAMTTPPTATLPDGGAMTLKWDHGSFASAVGQVGTTAVPNWTELAVGAAPFANLGGGFYEFVSALYLEQLIGNDAENTSIEPLSLSYADPFPTSWIRYVNAGIVVNVNLEYPLPDGGTLPINTLSASVTCTYNLSDELGQTVGPGLGPPSNVEVNGHPTSENQFGVGLEPEISWDPPTLGVPTAYGVEFEDIVVESDLSVVTSIVVEMTTTPSIRKLKIPPGVLQSSHEYVIEVFAVQGPSQDQPEVLGSPSCQANTTSALVEPGTSPIQIPDGGSPDGGSNNDGP